MSISNHQGGWIIALSIVLAYFISLIPMPEFLVYLNPNWVALVILYWCFALPERVGVLWAWLAGLFVDASMGTLLGQHALGFTVMIFVALRLHQRIRVFPVWQQAITVLLLLLLEQLFVVWISGIIGKPPNTIYYWLPSLTGALLWPPIYYLLRNIRIGFHVR